MKKRLIQEEWVRNLFPNSYFIKINGIWNKYSKDEVEKLIFKKEENIQWITGPGVSNWLYCQNDNCHSILAGNSFIEEREFPDKFIRDYVCSCCETKQHFIVDMVPFACNEEGVAITYTLTPCSDD